MMDATAMGDPDFDAWYVYGTYFLTGENRPYKTSSGTFDRVIPHRNFDGKGGLGAWEVGVRYAQIDLNDRLVKGGRLEDITFGVNWYINPNVRFHLNYVFGDVAHGGEANIVQARFQVDF
jgi:phosphate-selective porin OprO/OprP